MYKIKLAQQNYIRQRQKNGHIQAKYIITTLPELMIIAIHVPMLMNWDERDFSVTPELLIKRT